MAGRKNNAARTLISIMTVLVVLGISIAWFYYKGINDSVDPRVKQARKLYEKYNSYASLSQYDSVFWLMDTIENLYQHTNYYRESYETAVLYNNRAAALLSIYLQPQNEIIIGDTIEFITRAEKAVRKSIEIYQEWFSIFESKDESEIRKIIEEDFLEGLDAYPEKEQENFLSNRIKELVEAQTENERRLSVSYTNLGILKRHQEKYDSAAFYYQKAIDLWDRNLTAENNLNILLNKPLKKRNIIQTLFPPEK
jgi:tetratricopeptide (TPR) repeat protein